MEYSSSHPAAIPKWSSTAVHDQGNGLGSKLGLIYLYSVPLVAGLATARGVTIAGFNYTGWIWVLMLLGGIGLLLLDRARRIQSQFYIVPFVPWAIWYGYVWLSLLWCDDPGRRNIQDALQISMPLLVGAVAACYATRRWHLSTLLAAFSLTLVPIFARLAIAAAGLMGDVDTHQGLRPLALTSILIACVILAQASRRPMWAFGGWAVCLAVTAVTGARTSTAVILLLPMFLPSARKNPVVRTITTVCVLGVAVVAAIGLFQTEFFQERFFHSGHGTLEDVIQGKISGSGRFETWPLVWDEAWKRPTFGAGVGTTYAFVPTVWEDMHQVHNDYLRIGFEFGFIGLAIFLCVVIWQMFELRKRIAGTDGYVRIAFAAALLGFLGFLLTATTDNTLIYNVWYMNPLMALMGAAYGVVRQDGDESSDASGQSAGTDESVEEAREK